MDGSGVVDPRNRSGLLVSYVHTNTHTPTTHARTHAAPGEANPIDQAWAAHGSRPPAPEAPVRVHPLAYAGERFLKLCWERGDDGGMGCVHAEACPSHDMTTSKNK